jgi:hypothetical protein
MSSRVIRLDRSSVLHVRWRELRRTGHYRTPWQCRRNMKRRALNGDAVAHKPTSWNEIRHAMNLLCREREVGASWWDDFRYIYHGRVVKIEVRDLRGVRNPAGMELLNRHLAECTGYGCIVVIGHVRYVDRRAVRTPPRCERVTGRKRKPRYGTSGLHECNHRRRPR